MSDSSVESLVLPSDTELKKAVEEKRSKSKKNSKHSISDDESEKENDVATTSSGKSGGKIRHNIPLLEVEETEKEFKYRRLNFSDESDIMSSRKLRCTSCHTNLQSIVLEGRDVFHHPVLKVLMCKTCIGFYGDGNFSIDEDGSDKYCRWCAQGGTLYCCSTCCCAFCRSCIKRNLNRSILDDIEKTDWRCFVCKGEPLWELRAICFNAQCYSKKNRRKKREENERNLKKMQKKSGAVTPRSRRLNRRQKKTKSDSSSEDDSDSKKKKKKKKSRKKRNSSSESNVGRNKNKKSSRDSDSDIIEVEVPKKHVEVAFVIDTEEEDSRSRRTKNKSVQEVSIISTSDLEDSDTEESDRSDKKTKRTRRKDNKGNREKSKSKTVKGKKLKNAPDETVKSSSDQDSDNDSDLEIKKEVSDQLPDQVDDKCAKNACDWLEENVKDLARLGELLSFRAQRILNKKVNQDNMSDPDNVDKAVKSLKLLVQLAKENMEHTSGYVSLNHKYWVKKVVKRNKQRKPTKKQSEKDEDNRNNEDEETKNDNADAQNGVESKEEEMQCNSVEKDEEPDSVQSEDNAKNVNINEKDISNHSSNEVNENDEKTILDVIDANDKSVNIGDNCSKKRKLDLSDSDENDKCLNDEVEDLNTENVIHEKKKRKVSDTNNIADEADEEVDDCESHVDVSKVDEENENDSEDNRSIDTVKVNGKKKDLLETEENDIAQASTVLDVDMKSLSENVPEAKESSCIDIFSDTSFGSFSTVHFHKNEESQVKDNAHKCNEEELPQELVNGKVDAVQNATADGNDDEENSDAATIECLFNTELEDVDKDIASIPVKEKKVHDLSDSSANDAKDKGDDCDDEMGIITDDGDQDKGNNCDDEMDISLKLTDDGDQDKGDNCDDEMDISLKITDDGDRDPLVGSDNDEGKKQLKETDEQDENMNIEKHTVDGDDGSGKCEIGKLQLSDDSSEDGDAQNESKVEYTDDALKAQQALLGYTSDDENDSGIDTTAKRNLRKKKAKTREDKPVRKRRPGPKSRTRKGLSTSSGSNLDSDSSDEETSKVTGTKKKKFKLKNTEAYKKDNKLGWKCTVVVERLPDDEFEKHYENYYTDDDAEPQEPANDDKEIESLVNLKSLKRTRQQEDEESSDADVDANADADQDKKKIKLKRKEKKEKEAEEKLMDFFNKESDDSMVADASDSEKEAMNMMKMKKKSLLERENDMAMKMLLGSSSENDDDDDDDDKDASDKETEDEEKKKKKKKKKKPTKVKTEDNEEEEKKEIENKEAESETAEEKAEENVEKDKNEEESSDNDEKTKEKKKSNWRKDKLLTEKLSDLDTSDEEQLWKSKKEREREKKEAMKKNVRRRILGSDESDIVVSDEKSSTSDSSDIFVKKKRKKKSKKSDSDDTDSSGRRTKNVKRKRIKAPASDSSDDGEVEASQKSGGTPGKGRKNIHHIMKDDNVAEATRRAAREEEERRKRILDKQKLYNSIFKEIEGVETVDKLVLDFDLESKEELVSVDTKIVQKLKPHQVKGVKFMWDACFESLKQIKKTKGSGCILAHCMGLGKTLQVVALVHTLLNHEKTRVKTVLVVCPLSTVLNWVNEFNMWLKGKEVNVFELSKYKQNYERMYQLRDWQDSGGVMVMGYDMFRNLTNENTKRLRKKAIETFQSTLVDPGPDLIVCDEGHMLKNEDTALAKAMRKITTLRRIVLTGTPLQNNLKEYHCMVQFVKPSLLGTRKEFLNRFVNPITNGQFEDSTAYDVKIMKRRAHVLHKMLEGSVQRFDYSVLTPFLPPKNEYVISIRLSEIQLKAYAYYLENLARRKSGEKVKGAMLFTDFQNLQRIWTHPRVLQMSVERAEKTAERKAMMESDSEGSLKDFVVHDSSEESGESDDSSDDSDVQVVGEESKKNEPQKRRNTRSQGLTEDPEVKELEKKIEEEQEKSNPLNWWKQFIAGDELESMKYSGKLVLLFSILRESEKIGDKVLVFSQSLFSLDLIEYFLGRIDNATQSGEKSEELNCFTGSWALGLDYFRLDGSTPGDIRSQWCKSFNRDDNHRARLFIISTRAGGLGINLYAANRVIIFDASWNPSHDVQSIFRVYRFGQKKPCYIYRFLAQGTMEEKIYDRQVTKLSLSCRVVDEQQIERHYNMADLQELYQFNPEPKTNQPTPILPKDRLLADMIQEHEQWIVTYHEHDSLLENKEEEELNEEERKAAWEEYENEKNNKTVLPSAAGTVPMFPKLNFQALRQALRRENPLLSDYDLEVKMSTVVSQIFDYMNVRNTTGAGNAPILPKLNFTALSQTLRRESPQLTEEQLDQRMSTVVTQIFDYVNAPQPSASTMADPNLLYTPQQLQALKNYQVQYQRQMELRHQQLGMDQDASQFRMEQDPFRNANYNANASFRQYLQDQNDITMGKAQAAVYPTNLYRNVALDKSGNFKMQSKLVPINVPGASSSVLKPNFTTEKVGGNHLISRQPVILPNPSLRSSSSMVLSHNIGDFMPKSLQDLMTRQDGNSQNFADGKKPIIPDDVIETID